MYAWEAGLDMFQAGHRWSGIRLKEAALGPQPAFPLDQVDFVLGIGGSQETVRFVPFPLQLAASLPSALVLGLLLLGPSQGRQSTALSSHPRSLSGTLSCP